MRNNDVAVPISDWSVRWVRLGIGILALAVVGLFAWSLPRGLDLTDEGFYLLNYRYPAEYEASFTDFHLVIARVFGLADVSILAYRVVGLLAALLGAGLFGLSLAAWLRQVLPPGPRRWLTRSGLVVLVVLLGELLAYSISARTISYNTLNTLLVLVGAAGVLQALRRGLAGRGWLVVMGATAGLDVFVKVSSAGLILFAAVGVLGWCWRRTGVAWLVQAAALLALGVGVGMGVYFVRAQAPDVWWHTFSREISMVQAQSYGTGSLLTKYFGSARDTLRVLAWPLGPALAGLMGVLWWWPRRGTRAGWHLPFAAAVIGASGLWLAAQAVRRLWYSTTYLNDFETLAVLLGFLLLGAVAVASELALTSLPAADAAPAARWPSQVLPVGLWLLALPLLAVAGTYNDLRINLVADAAPWFGLLLLLLALPRPVGLPAWVAGALLLLPVGYAAEQVGWGILRAPYILTGPMTAQNTPLHAAGLKGPLLLDPAAVAFVGKVEQTLARAGFRAGDPLLAFYDMPGLVYLCGGVSPGATWYFTGIDLRNCHALNITRQPLRQACVLLNSPLGPGMQRCLREHGVRFPEGYYLVGEVPNAYAVNTYMYRTGQRMVQVYAPLPTGPSRYSSGVR